MEEIYSCFVFFDGYKVVGVFNVEYFFKGFGNEGLVILIQFDVEWFGWNDSLEFYVVYIFLFVYVFDEESQVVFGGLFVEFEMLYCFFECIKDVFLS